jgi:4-amino-4-deoxy-L-arabinose transferase-like glycosyltransferase
MNDGAWAADPPASAHAPRSATSAWRTVHGPRSTVFVLILLAFALRAYHLDFQSLWSDEGISLLRASLPLSQLLREMPVEHAPGYFVLLHFWIRLLGTSDYALRFLSLWPSVATIAIAYRLGADLGSRRAGAITALLLATNAFQVWYAQEARMYSWLLAISLAATWLLWCLLRTSAARRRWAIAGAYAITMAATLYWHYYGFLTPLAHTIFMAAWLWHSRRTGAWLTSLRTAAVWALAGMAVFLLYIPWLSHALGIFNFSGWRAPADPWQIPWRYLVAYTVGDAMPAPWRNWLPWLYLALAGIGAVTWVRRARPLGWLLLLTMVAVPLAAVLALALRNPDFHERYAIMISAPLLLIVAGGMGVGGRRPETGDRRSEIRDQRSEIRDQRSEIGGSSFVIRHSSFVLLALLLAANILALTHLYSDAALQKPDYRSAARQVERWERPGDIILVDGLDPQKVFLHYYRGTAPVHDLRTLDGAGGDEVDAFLSAITGGAGRAWGIRYFRPPGEIQFWMAKHGWAAAAVEYNGIHLTLYGLRPDAETMVKSDLSVPFGPTLTLTQVELEKARQAHAGDMLRITTRWQVNQPPPALKFSLRLWDRTGRIVLSDDYVPRDWFTPTDTWQPGKSMPDRRGLWLPSDLPPGSYRVTLRLYDAASAPVMTDAGADFPLMGIEVVYAQ